MVLGIRRLKVNYDGSELNRFSETELTYFDFELCRHVRVLSKRASQSKSV